MNAGTSPSQLASLLTGKISRRHLDEHLLTIFS